MIKQVTKSFVVSIGVKQMRLNSLGTSKLLETTNICTDKLSKNLSVCGYKGIKLFSTFNNKPANNNKKSSIPQQEKYRSNFINDYLYYKAVPWDMRQEQLERIIASKPSDQQYQGKLKQCEIQDKFQHNGLKLNTYTWLPPNKVPVKAVIVYYHSLNGHTMMVSQFAEKISKKGYIVTGFDYPNFGKSEGKLRGEISTFTQVAEPSEMFFNQVRKKYQHKPIYMMGNSLGGAVAFCLANKLQQKQVTGLIMLSPAIRQNRHHVPVLKRIGFILSMILPKFRLWKARTRNGSKLKLDNYSSTDSYLYTEGMWTSTLRTMITSLSIFKKQFKYLKNPYLIIQSGTDKLIDPFLAIDLEKQSESKDKTTVIIKDMWHNVWFDTRRKDVMKIIEEWLEERN